ncbi:hypothetical protein [Synechococcus sp. CCY 9618]|nr:hypothetical protein [Synechococcus sp. CCY 9618]
MRVPGRSLRRRPGARLELDQEGICDHPAALGAARGIEDMAIGD